MMLEFLGAIIISQSSPPPGPPYYPSPESKYDQQGFSGCECGDHPAGGTVTTWEGWEVSIYTKYIYSQEYNYDNPYAENNTAWGCRTNYICNQNGCMGGWLGVTKSWVGPIEHQPTCRYWSDPTPEEPPKPCPRVRIQGMPGQTIRVRCKGDECTNTNRIKPE